MTGPGPHPFPLHEHVVLYRGGISGPWRVVGWTPARYLIEVPADGGRPQALTTARPDELALW